VTADACCVSEAGAAADGGATEGSWGDGVPGKKCKREVFDILACISDSYLRLTTAHTQAKKNNYYSNTPHLPLKVVTGSIFVFSSVINIE
jgi:hypothetical protein